MKSLLTPIIVAVIAISAIYSIRYKESLFTWFAPAIESKPLEKSCKSKLVVGQEFIVDSAAMWLFRISARRHGIKLPSGTDTSYSYGRISNINCDTGVGKAYLNLYSSEFELYPDVWSIEQGVLKIDNEWNQKEAIELSKSPDVEDRMETINLHNKELEESIKQKEEELKKLVKALDKKKQTIIR